jgi:GT2 family glycosyltransferase
MAKKSGSTCLMTITASLVLYRNAPDLFEEAIRSVLESDVESILSIVDNSPDPLTSRYFNHPRVIYEHAAANLGFGAAHNRAFAAVSSRSNVHFIINPDISFGPKVLGALANIFVQDLTVMAAMPAIHDDDDVPQNLCKALPTPVNLIVRRFVPFRGIRNAIDRTYEFRNLPTQGLVDIPNLSGCFLGIRSTAFTKVGGFDEGFFMYMEDIDLVRRLGNQGRTVYVPTTKIHHGHARSSYRFGRLMFVHIRSALRYFHKWGWLYDRTRRARNVAARRALANQYVVKIER